MEHSYGLHPVSALLKEYTSKVGEEYVPEGELQQLSLGCKEDDNLAEVCLYEAIVRLIFLVPLKQILDDNN